MRLLILAAASSVAMTSVALSADLYVAAGRQTDDTAIPLAVWSGFYAGINGGYAFDALGSHGGVADEGGLGGFQLGYNWQGPLNLGPHVVLGVEADFEAAGIDHTGNDLIKWDDGTTSPAVHHRSIENFGTVRGRLGYSFGQTLVYFTGGFAYGSLLNTFDAGDAGGGTGGFHTHSHAGLYQAEGIQTGYVLGGGIEHKLSPAWSVKAEYQFIDLGNIDASNGQQSYIRTKDTMLDTVRAGINYHFGAPDSPFAADSAGGYKDGAGTPGIWSGFYLGANGGYAWGDGKLSSTDCVTRLGCTVDSAKFAQDGGFGGVQAGYNLQLGSIVTGFEADIQSADAKAGLSTPAVAEASSALNWFGTVRGRLGVPVLNNGLLYATGGFAYGGIEDKLKTAQYDASESKIAMGYAAGGGFEYAFGPEWSLKGEYLYIDLGKSAATASSGGTHGGQSSAVIDARDAFSVVRAGLNYHVTPVYEPLK